MATGFPQDFAMALDRRPTFCLQAPEMLKFTPKPTIERKIFLRINDKKEGRFVTHPKRFA